MADPRDPDAAYIPADDVILRGYCGPADFLQYRTWYPGVTLSPTHGYISRPGHGDDIAGYSPANIRLNPALAPVRDHIARVMAEGVRCPACKGSRMAAITVDPAYPCPDCHGSGYLLPPADIDPLIDNNRGHRLTPAQSAVLVADAYIRWRRGLPIPSVVRCSGTPLPDSMTRHYCIAANGTVTTPELPKEKA